MYKDMLDTIGFLGGCDSEVAQGMELELKRLPIFVWRNMKPGHARPRRI